MTRGENANNLPTEALQRMLNYTFYLIEDKLTKDDEVDGYDDCYYDESSESGVDGNDFKTHVDDAVTENASDDNNDVDSDTGDNTLGDFVGDNDDDIGDFDYPYCIINEGLKFMRNIFPLNRVMSESELDEVGLNSSYMQSLIKCVAEIYLTENEMDEWLSERNDEQLSYLYDFHEILEQNLDIIRALNKLLENRNQACDNFIRFGGIEVCTFILEGIDSVEDLAETATLLKEMLKHPKSYILRYHPFAFYL
ncbi:hypothetical protein ACTXT7_011751 [Hymenolepis weldensis]